MAANSRATSPEAGIGWQSWEGIGCVEPFAGHLDRDLEPYVRAYERWPNTVSASHRDGSEPNWPSPVASLGAVGNIYRSRVIRCQVATAANPLVARKPNNHALGSTRPRPGHHRSSKRAAVLPTIASARFVAEERRWTLTHPVETVSFPSRLSLVKHRASRSGVDAAMLEAA